MTLGIDLIGFGPIGRELAARLVTEPILKEAFHVASISDSSGTIHPSSNSEVVKAVEWKQGGRKLRDLKLEHDNATGSSIGIDLTNSDYGKVEEARARALGVLDSGKHFVSANKVALANNYSEIFEEARRKGVSIGLGATICGGRQAISVARNLDKSEVLSASAVLNASTTLILSMLEADEKLTFDLACERASESGVLESDWSVDLDGVDAAAKTAILANVLFPESKMAIKKIHTRGIRDEKAKSLIQSTLRGKVRLVSEITNEKASVEPRAVPSDSPLAVTGRFNAVQLCTKTLGEISVRNLGGGVSLTASVIISDLKDILRNSPLVP